MPLCAYMLQYIKEICLQAIVVDSKGETSVVYIAWKLHVGTDTTCELTEVKLWNIRKIN